MADKVKNLPLTMKFFSVILAIILWLILTYTVNPTITQNVKNIPVTFNGTETLASKGLVLINTEELDGVDVKIRGARSSVINALSSIRASVDVSDINSSGTWNEYVSFDMGVSGVSIEGRNNALISVEVDELVEKSIPVKVLQNGSDKNRANIIKSSPEFEKLTVRGAKSELEKAKELIITVDVSDIEELQPEAEYSYYFVNTNDAKQVFPSMQNLPEKIRVTNYVYNRKTVPLKVELEKDEEKYQLNVKELSVNETDIGIPDGFDEEIGELTVGFSPEKYKEGQEEYTLDVTVPDGVYLPEASKTVTAKIELVRLEKSDIRLDVEVRNVASGLKAEVFPNNVTLTVREIEGAYAKDKLKAYVDASGLKEGNYELEVKTDSVDGVIVDEIAHVNVTVSK